MDRLLGRVPVGPSSGGGRLIVKRPGRLVVTVLGQEDG